MKVLAAAIAVLMFQEPFAQAAVAYSRLTVEQREAIQEARAERAAARALARSERAKRRKQLLAEEEEKRRALRRRRAQRSEETGWVPFGAVVGARDLPAGVDAGTVNQGRYAAPKRMRGALNNPFAGRATPGVDTRGGRMTAAERRAAQSLPRAQLPRNVRRVAQTVPPAAAGWIPFKPTAAQRANRADFFRDFDSVVEEAQRAGRKVGRKVGEFAGDVRRNAGALLGRIGQFVDKSAQNIHGLLAAPFAGNHPISSNFGPRSRPKNARGRAVGSAHHKGVDFALPSGTAVQAPGNGRIVTAEDEGDGYGIKVVIDHGNGKESILGHLSRAGVRGGMMVRAGQVVGLSGSTGHSTGPHLHYEIRDRGTAVNPMIAAAPTGAPKA